jgi:hypothetical protein
MLKIDRSEVDKAIENLGGMFNATQEVLNSYEAEKKTLEERGEVLAERLAQLQEQHTQTLLDREVAKDSPSDYIYLSTQLTKIGEEIKILLSLTEQQKEEFKALKQRYMPIISGTYSRDSATKSKYFNVSESVINVRDELKRAISDYESEIHKQDQKVMSVIYDDFLHDSELMNESWDNVERRRKALAFKRRFDFDRNRLFYDKTINL